MNPVKIISGIAAPFLRINVDTDAIIPSREIKAVSKKGLAEGLFSEWRYTSIADRTPNDEFILNREPFNRSVILITGDNFGCGSSREHAVWALQEWGIKAVIGSTFGSIFYGNCIRNGLLPIQLSPHDLQKLIDFVEKDPESNQILIDLDQLGFDLILGLSQQNQLIFEDHEGIVGWEVSHFLCSCHKRLIQMLSQSLL